VSKVQGVDEVVARKDLLSAEDVAGYLGVGQVTVYRWCREGRLPCLKIGKSWRIRRTALEDFLRHGERSATLVGQLRSFLEVPDNVIGIAQNLDLLHRLDAAFSVSARREVGCWSSTSAASRRPRWTSCAPSWIATAWTWRV
jgi:excisionase family DNA binding protein